MERQNTELIPSKANHGPREIKSECENDENRAAQINPCDLENGELALKSMAFEFYATKRRIQRQRVNGCKHEQIPRVDNRQRRHHRAKGGMTPGTAASRSKKTRAS